MGREIGLVTAAALLAGCAVADAQEALPTEYGYTLAAKTDDAAYFLSGIRRGAEPGSVEAWIWTVLRKPVASNYDARAQLSVMRCESRSIQPLKTEHYREGQIVKAAVEPWTIPIDIRKETPMEGVWNVACDMMVRFRAKHLRDVSDIYQEAETDQPSENPVSSPPS